MNAIHDDDVLLERLRAICAEVDPMPDLVQPTNPSVPLVSAIGVLLAGEPAPDT